MSTRKQIENYCKKNKLIELNSDNLGGDKYYFDVKKNIVIKFSLFSKNPTSFKIATKSEINDIIKSYEISTKRSRLRKFKSSKRSTSKPNY
jgi:hypothetical protein